MALLFSQITNLESLEIRDGLCLERVFDRLKLPKLMKFVHFDCEPGRSLYASMTSLFQRSAPPLTCLDLCDESSTTDLDLIECLQQCPSLQDLSLTYGSAMGVNRRLFHRLTHFAAETTCCLVPLLQSFTVDVMDKFNFAAFTTMIESRWQGPSRDCHAADHKKIHQLKQATMRRCWGMWAEDAVEHIDVYGLPWFHRLQQFQAEGFLLTTENKGRSIPLLNFVSRPIPAY